MKQNKKQTAVDWLVDKLLDHLDLLSIEEYGLISVVIDDLSDQAKEMEKEQIINAYERGDKYKTEISGKQYYKETYGDE